jgi:hypothetical protein
VAPGSACATELAMTEHAGATAAVTTAATNRVRVRMLGICRQGLTCMTASRAGNRALLEIAIRRPQPAACRRQIRQLSPHLKLAEQGGHPAPQSRPSAHLVPPIPGSHLKGRDVRQRRRTGRQVVGAGCVPTTSGVIGGNRRRHPPVSAFIRTISTGWVAAPSAATLQLCA